MKQFRQKGVLGCMLALLVAQPVSAKTLYKWGFEDSAEGWKAVSFRSSKESRRVKVEQTTQPKWVKKGRGALMSKYRILPQYMYILYRPLKLKKNYAHFELNFWVRSEKSRQLFLAMTEKDGSLYMSRLSLDTTGKWQKIKLTDQDFQFDKHTENNTDENQKLDLGQVNRLSIIDAMGLEAQMAKDTMLLLDHFYLKGS